MQNIDNQNCRGGYTLHIPTDVALVRGRDYLKKHAYKAIVRRYAHEMLFFVLVDSFGWGIRPLAVEMGLSPSTGYRCYDRGQFLNKTMKSFFRERAHMVDYILYNAKYLR